MTQDKILPCDPGCKGIGFEIKSISNLIKRYVDRNFSRPPSDNTTQVQGWIIGYLYERRGGDIFQRDLEEAFRIRRPTVSAMLGKMEQSGYIVRESVPRDARLKKIVLTGKAVELHKHIEEDIARIEADLARGITDEELVIFRRVLDKIRANISEEKPE
ncbi:MAG: MarR family transcriptional regulator [Eubacteriales bacterium]